VINTCRYVWIDLKEAKWIDKVSFVVSDNNMRTKGVKFWLGDTLPLPGADTSDWVYLGETEKAVAYPEDEGALNEFVLTPDQADQWRYVIADFTGQDVGGYIQEIDAYQKVYVK